MTSPDLTPLRRLGTTRLQALLAAAVFAWLFRGLLVGDCFLQADLHQLIEPLRQLLASSVHQGQFTWTSALGNGSALLGNPLHALAYPPNWLCFLIEPALALSWLNALHLTWGAVGAWLLAKQRGGTPVATWTAAAAFTLCGVSLSASLIPTLGWTLSWLPWLVIAHARSRSRRDSLAPVLALALILAILLVLAEPTLLFAALFWLAIAEVRPLLRSRGRRLPWRTVGAGLLALGLALPAVLPVLRTVGDSVRASGFEQEGMLQWSLHPFEPLAWVAPELLGDPDLVGLEGHWATQLWPARASGFYHGTYWGGLLLALAVAGACTHGRKRNELLVWLALLSLLALGRNGPIFPLLSGVPLADSWRYPVKWLTPMSLPLALLAARGIESLDRPAARRAFVVTAFLTLLACLALAVPASSGHAGILWSLIGPGGEVPSWFPAHLSRAGWAGALPLLLAGALFAALRQRATRGAWLPVALTALLTVDLLLANSALLPTVPLSAYRRVPEVVQVLRDEEPPVERLWIEPARDLRWESEPRTREAYHRWERDALRLYMASSFGLPLSFPVDFEAMAPFDTARLAQMIASAPQRERLMLLGASGVTHLGSFEDYDPRWTEALSSHEVRTARPLRLYRNRLAVPRARVVAELIPHASDAELYRAIGSAADDLFTSAALIERDALAELPPREGARSSDARILSDEGSELVVAARGPGYLIVSDPLVSGWTAELDGEPVEMFRADVAFRGIVLPDGEHEVRLRFSPW